MTTIFFKGVYRSPILVFYVATLFLVVQIQWKSVFYDVLPVWISTRPECRGSIPDLL